MVKWPTPTHAHTFTHVGNSTDPLHGAARGAVQLVQWPTPARAVFPLAQRGVLHQQGAGWLVGSHEDEWSRTGAVIV